MPGRNAKRPWHLPLAAWKQVLIRTWNESGQDHIGIVAAGVAYYGFLAIVPMMGVIVLSYGLLADPAAVVKDMESITAVMPADAAKLIGEQLMNVVQTSSGKKGVALLLALALALYGAMSGASAIVTALDIAYEEKETRSLMRFYGLVLTITVSAVAVAIVAMIAIAALGHLENLFPDAPRPVLWLGKSLSYVFLVLAGAAGAATLYRYGPDRRKAQWVWITPGSLGSAIGWLALTAAFGLYVAHFGNYNATYGSLGAVVVLLTWLYLSSYVLLLGAELNAECERQTAHDTTDGPPMPIGQRGAAVADQVVTGTQAPPAAKEGPSEAVVDPAPPPPAPTAAPGPIPVSGERPFAPRDYAVARVVARTGRMAGFRKVDVAPTLLATLGLSLLRREGRGLAGAALLGLGGAWAWQQRERGDGALCPPDAEAG